MAGGAIKILIVAVGTGLILLLGALILTISGEESDEQYVLERVLPTPTLQPEIDYGLLDHSPEGELFDASDSARPQDDEPMM